MKSKIIIVGPSAAGKDFLRRKFVKRGFTSDISYTTRKPREEEKDYVFISKAEFIDMIADNKFYEWVEYEGNYYGTGIKEWLSRDIFIMETVGVSKINVYDRNDCMIIFIDPPRDSRIKRMSTERKWPWSKIKKRLIFDE